MKFVVYGMGITLARRLRTLRGWLSLLLIPALVLGLYRALPAGEMTAPVQVGVCLPESGGEEFWELLEGHSGTVLTFLVSSEGEIEARVASGQWDCGVILPEDFDRKRCLDLFIAEYCPNEFGLENVETCLNSRADLRKCKYCWTSALKND